MSDSLAEIRHVHHILAALSKFTHMNVARLGQRSVTQQATLYTCFKDKQAQSAQRYQAACAAMQNLDPTEDWQSIYCPLLDTNLHGPRQDKDEVIISEGRYKVSWIWLTPGREPSDNTAQGSDSELMETMHAEWA